MDAEEIAAKARRSIGKFCAEECHSYCCRKGYLVVSRGQLAKMMHGREADYADAIKAIDDGTYSLFMGKSDRPCPSLNPDLTCSIHRSKLRPEACRHFPLFLKDGKVIASSRCMAVRQGMLFPHIKRLQMLGYKYCKSGDENIDMMSLL